MSSFGILGSGSWGTALAKILTDNGNHIHWWNRSETVIEEFKTRFHNPQYLLNAKFAVNQLSLTTNAEEVIQKSDVIVIAIPSAFALEALEKFPSTIFEGKKIVSAIKGILPNVNLLLNDYLAQKFNVQLSDYFTVLGPCHAEEVAQEKLSYLTFSGTDEAMAIKIAAHFKTAYINTLTNNDIFGVQFAAVLKNIYAVGAGMAHGLGYGDNFLSVLIANSADEMVGFLKKAGPLSQSPAANHNNYAASVFLGDLLVTCYSLHSRNRRFGTMIGKGYTVQTAQLEMSMVAEGYNAAKCMFAINEKVGASMPIATAVYKILWEGVEASDGFLEIENVLI